MGKNHPGFHQAVIEILKNHLEDFEETEIKTVDSKNNNCLLYTSPSPRDATLSRMPSSA